MIVQACLEVEPVVGCVLRQRTRTSIARTPSAILADEPISMHTCSQRVCCPFGFGLHGDASRHMSQKGRQVSESLAPSQLPVPKPCRTSNGVQNRTQCRVRRIVRVLELDAHRPAPS